MPVLSYSPYQDETVTSCYIKIHKRTKWPIYALSSVAQWNAPIFVVIATRWMNDKSDVMCWQSYVEPGDILATPGRDVIPECCTERQIRIHSRSQAAMIPDIATNISNDFTNRRGCSGMLIGVYSADICQRAHAITSVCFVCLCVLCVCGIDRKTGDVCW